MFQIKAAKASAELQRCTSERIAREAEHKDAEEVLKLTEEEEMEWKKRREDLKMEEAKTCAMQRLMTEEYIPDQVEQAYKRSRGIEEEEEAAAMAVAQPSHLPTHRLRAKT